MDRKKKKISAKKPVKKNKPLKVKKMSSEEKKKLAGTVAAGVGAGIGAAFWYVLKKVLLGLAFVCIMIILAKIIWSSSTGNPYPWGWWK